MDDIGEKINELLSDEESMKQIKELADMLSSGDSSGSSESVADPGPNLSTLSGLFGALGAAGAPDGAKNETENANSSGGIDMNMIMQLFSVLSDASTPDKNRSLLLALKPHMSDKRQEKIDKAVRLLKLYAVFTEMRDKNMLNGLDKLL